MKRQEDIFGLVVEPGDTNKLEIRKITLIERKQTLNSQIRMAFKTRKYNRKLTIQKIGQKTHV